MKIKNRIFPTTSDVIYPSASLVVDAVGLAHPKSLNHFENSSLFDVRIWIVNGESCVKSNGD
jgi:hypothetical protein